MNRRKFLQASGIGLAGSQLALPQTPRRSGRPPVAAFKRPKPATGPLRVHPTNPRYFADASGTPVFLTGSHTWANLQEMGVAPVPKFDWKGYIDFMERYNHNFMRLWQWEQAAWAPWTAEKILFEPLVYQRTGPGTAPDGGPKFDLTRFNEAYFERLHARVRECRDRGIYCAVQLFNGFSYFKKDPGQCGSPLTFPGHPYHKDANINGMDGDRNQDAVLDLHDSRVREFHATYIRKVVDCVNDLDNVLYEVINEGGNKDWDWWVVDTIHALEKAKGRSHPVGITGFGGETFGEMLASPAEWFSADGRENPKFKTDPPAWDGRKVSVLDTDHLWGHGGTSSWAWRSFLRGHNTLLMDAWEPLAGKSCAGVNWGSKPGFPNRDLNRRDDPVWEPVRRAMGNTAYYAARMDLAHTRPLDDLSSTSLCLATPGREYLTYLPEGDEVTLDLTSAAGITFSAEWMHPIEGRIIPSGTVKGGRKVHFLVPLIGPAVLYLRAV